MTSPDQPKSWELFRHMLSTAAPLKSIWGRTRGAPPSTISSVIHGFYPKKGREAKKSQRVTGLIRQRGPGGEDTKQIKKKYFLRKQTNRGEREATWG